MLHKSYGKAARRIATAKTKLTGQYLSNGNGPWHVGGFVSFPVPGTSVVDRTGARALRQSFEFPSQELVVTMPRVPRSRPLGPYI